VSRTFCWCMGKEKVILGSSRRFGHKRGRKKLIEEHGGRKMAGKKWGEGEDFAMTQSASDKKRQTRFGRHASMIESVHREGDWRKSRVKMGRGVNPLKDQKISGREGGREKEHAIGFWGLRKPEKSHRAGGKAGAKKSIADVKRRVQVLGTRFA